MPGLAGIVDAGAGLERITMSQKLIAAMHHSDRLRVEMRASDTAPWALGRVHLGVLNPEAQLTADGALQVLFHGELSNLKELRGQLEHKVPLQQDSGVCDLIKSLYRMHGTGFPSLLQGSFVALVLDEHSKRILLVNDFLGSYPLYWFRGQKYFTFAGELNALFRGAGIEPHLDSRAVADYLTFGFLFGDKTLASEVRLLPPASTLSYCWADEKCIIQSYASIQEVFQPREGPQSEYLEEVCGSFERAVGRATSQDYEYLLSISGGLDSRAILGAMDWRRGRISSYTLGVKGCADEVIARQLCRISGMPNRFFEIDSSYLSDYLTNLRRMVKLTDGMYLTHGLTEILVLRFLEESHFGILLRGHGGELAKASLAWPLHTDQRVYGMHDKCEFVSYILGRANYISGNVPLNELFVDEWWSEMNAGARLSLEESVATVELSPPDLCSYLYLTQHHRRFTIASLELFRNYLEVRLPFVDEEFLRVLFRSRPQWRDKTDIHRALIGRNCPALLKVRNSNTGAPGDAGPLSEAVWDKVNSVLKRLNVYGYRHYHNFESWMRQKIVTSVEKVLLQPRCLARGIYRAAGLRRLIDETKRGVVDHAYLLQILLILELWQQENE